MYLRWGVAGGAATGPQQASRVRERVLSLRTRRRGGQGRAGLAVSVVTRRCRVLGCVRQARGRCVRRVRPTGRGARGQRPDFAPPGEICAAARLPFIMQGLTKAKQGPETARRVTRLARGLLGFCPRASPDGGLDTSRGRRPGGRGHAPAESGP